MIHSKTLRSLALGLMLALGISSVQAHGPRGYVGFHYGWGGYYDPWLAPAIVGTAIVGTSIYMSRPYGVVQPSTVYINTPPPAVIVSNPPPPLQWVARQMPQSLRLTTAAKQGSIFQLRKPASALGWWFTSANKFRKPRCHPAG